nr:unnamed protein product [Callosobruchus analis]
MEVEHEDLVTITNADLFETWVSVGKQKNEAVASKIMFLLGIDTNECPVAIETEISRISLFFCLTDKNKWEKCGRMRSAFLKKNEAWLKLHFPFQKPLDYSCYKIRIYY